MASHAVNLDLHRFPNLHVLQLAIPASPGMDMAALQLFEAHLNSWSPPHSGLLELAAVAPAARSQYPMSDSEWGRTRESFVAVLSHMGRISENILVKLAVRVVVHIKDIKAYHSWWRHQVLGCFPALNRASRVRVKFSEQSELGLG